jgi:uncharacterized coiled-coil DUF342 family protein
MTAVETIQKRIEELKRKMADYQECIEHHQRCIAVFLKSVDENAKEIKELSELADGAKALSSPHISL